VVANVPGDYTVCSPVWTIHATGQKPNFHESAAFNAMLTNGSSNAPLVMHAGAAAHAQDVEAEGRRQVAGAVGVEHRPAPVAAQVGPADRRVVAVHRERDLILVAGTVVGAGRASGNGHASMRRIMASSLLPVERPGGVAHAITLGCGEPDVGEPGQSQKRRAPFHQIPRLAAFVPKPPALLSWQRRAGPVCPGTRIDAVEYVTNDRSRTCLRTGRGEQAGHPGAPLGRWPERADGPSPARRIPTPVWLIACSRTLANAVTFPPRSARPDGDPHG
jgi:hypothetical protein